jgi:hypothetical protein
LQLGIHNTEQHLADLRGPRIGNLDKIIIAADGPVRGRFATRLHRKFDAINAALASRLITVVGADGAELVLMGWTALSSDVFNTSILAHRCRWGASAPTEPSLVSTEETR